MFTAKYKEFIVMVTTPSPRSQNNLILQKSIFQIQIKFLPWVSPQSCEGQRRPLKGALGTAQYEFTSAPGGRLLKDQVV